MTSTRLSLTARVVLAALCLGGSLLSWSAARDAEARARLQEQLSTLTPIAGAPAAPSRLPVALAWITGGDIAHALAGGEYWDARYDRLAEQLTPAESEDPALLLLSANAAFRRSQRDAGPSGPTIADFDRAIQSYAAVLRNGGFDRDAAFNFEYLVRRRDAAARAVAARGPKPVGEAPATPRPPFTRSDLPAGPTVHGQPGTHPPATRGEDFEIITPMDYGDREAQPQQTPGVRLPRKG